MPWWFPSTNGVGGGAGTPGKSAYEVATANGFVGTVQQWLASLKGADGAPGANGSNGLDGAPGVNGKDAPVYQSIPGSAKSITVTSGAAVGLGALPALTAGARITVEGGSIRTTTDGTTPVAGGSPVGDLWEVGTGWQIESNADTAAFLAIAVSTTATLQVTFLKVAP